MNKYFITLIFITIFIILSYSISISNKNDKIKYLFFIISFLLVSFSAFSINKKSINYNRFNKIEDFTNSNALTLANYKINKLINYINSKYSDDYLNSLKNKNTIQDLINNLNSYNYKTLYEYFPQTYGKNTSVNMNKGEIIYLCIKDFETKKNHNINEIIFVLLHEITHSLDSNIGHTKSFWSIFNWILQNATECKIYKLIDYKKNNITYCSTLIDYQPLLDNQLKLE